MTEGNRKRVLVVEDDADIRAMLEMSMRHLYEVDQAADGMEGLGKAREEPHPDLIISDIMMPHLDGLRMVGRLRSGASTKDIPVIFLTARRKPNDITAGITAGATYYMTKPFKVTEVIKTVQSVLEASSGQQAPV